LENRGFPMLHGTVAGDRDDSAPIDLYIRCTNKSRE
jgi:hypothetical protein